MPAERSEGRSVAPLNTNPQGGQEEQEVREANNRVAGQRKLALVRSEPPSFGDAQYGVAPFTRNGNPALSSCIVPLPLTWFQFLLVLLSSVWKS
jgi:hypothetical protein